MPEASLVNVVILNWNGLPHVLRTLDAVLSSNYPALSVILVDNGSTDASVKMIQGRFPDVICQLAGKNLGYAAGNNLGLRQAMQLESEYVLLLNDDTVITPDMISALVLHLQQNQEAGIASPKIHLLNAPQRLWAVGGIFRSRRVITLGIDEVDLGQYDSEELDFVFGCSMMIRREVLERIGVLDDRFRFYYEDIDLCLRAKRAGYGVVWVPSATMWHMNPVNTQGTSRFKVYHYERSRMLFYFKYLRGIERYTFALLQILHILGLVARYALHGHFAAAFWGSVGAIVGVLTSWWIGLRAEGKTI